LPEKKSKPEILVLRPVPDVARLVERHCPASWLELMPLAHVPELVRVAIFAKQARELLAQSVATRPRCSECGEIATHTTGDFPETVEHRCPAHLDEATWMGSEPPSKLPDWCDRAAELLAWADTNQAQPDRQANSANEEAPAVDVRTLLPHCPECRAVGEGERHKPWCSKVKR